MSEPLVLNKHYERRFDRGAWATALLVVFFLIWGAAISVYFFTLPTDGWLMAEDPEAPGAPGFVYVYDMLQASSGLQLGDQIQAVEGIQLGTEDLSSLSPLWQAGNVLDYRVIRGVTQLEVQAPLVHWQIEPAFRAFVLKSGGIAGLLGSLAFLIIAALTFYRRANDHAARTLLMLASLILLGGGPTSLLTTSLNAEIDSGMRIISIVTMIPMYTVLLPPLFLRLAMVFPQPKPILRAHPRLEYLPFLIGLLTVLLYVWLGSLLYAWTIGSIFGAIGILLHSAVTLRDATSRAQLRWGLWGSIVALAMTLPAYLPTFGLISGTMADIAYAISSMSLGVMGITLSIAILRYRLFDIDVIIRRTIVYGVLTACVIGIYVGIVGYVGNLLQVREQLVSSLIATGIIAVLFQPVRERIQRAVNRLMFGERQDPYRVLVGLGSRLGAAFEPSAILPTLTQTVSESLKLPFVAIAWQQEGTTEIVASTGTASTAPVKLPLFYQGTEVGELLVTPRRGEPALSPSDYRLLADLAKQAGAAVHGVRLMSELQRSRERLVLAREEERRQLRRELHDDVAPTIAGWSLTIGTIGELISHQPAKANEMVRELHGAMRNAVGHIRRLAYDLRPPTLDELGLVAAIRERASQYDGQRLNNHALRVSFEAPEAMPALPAAVEVAAYRIVQEALTNIVKHAQAHECCIRLRATDLLELEITDDGKGMPTSITSGVGLRSMRERAAELGGSLEIRSMPKAGTKIEVNLPLQNAKSHDPDSRSDRAGAEAHNDTRDSM